MGPARRAGRELMVSTVAARPEPRRWCRGARPGKIATITAGSSVLRRATNPQSAPLFGRRTPVSAAGSLRRAPRRFTKIITAALAGSLISLKKQRLKIVARETRLRARDRKPESALRNPNPKLRAPEPRGNVEYYVQLQPQIHSRFRLGALQSGPGRGGLRRA